MIKSSDIKKFWIWSLFCVIIGISILPLSTMGMDKEKKEMEIKAKFYKLNRETYTKGEFLGTVEMKDDDFTIEVSDSELEKFLSKALAKPYQTFIGEVRGGFAVERQVTLEPGTRQHFKAILEECWKKYRIIGEIVED